MVAHSERAAGGISAIRARDVQYCASHCPATEIAAHDGALGAAAFGGFESSANRRSATTFSSPGCIWYGTTAAWLAISLDRSPGRPCQRNARLRIESDFAQFLAADAEPGAVPACPVAMNVAVRLCVT